MTRYTTKSGHTVEINERSIWEMNLTRALTEAARYPTVGHIWRAEPVEVTAEDRRRIHREVRQASNEKFGPRAPRTDGHTANDFEVVKG